MSFFFFLTLRWSASFYRCSFSSAVLRASSAFSSLVVILLTIDLSYSSSIVPFVGARGSHGNYLSLQGNEIHTNIGQLTAPSIAHSSLLFVFSLVCDERTDGYYAIAILSEVLAFLKTIPGAPQDVILWPVVGQYAHKLTES